MPLERLALILVCVVVAAGLTIWSAALFIAAVQLPVPGFLVLIPALLVGWIVFRVIADRLSNAEDDHYDKIEK
ncbi:hypothetical protein [Oceaniovalibus sp. ACAM 378]|jgi:hypothetical protein|uniref:hypothetical protein n=1 Tax=Oceaniovalibus sp. ACAM 378 TaxID=2599923 RepID=UPI0011D9C06E|nr:hypothetical protein [Oceaniovalibus sp. ACAM 378]TYB87738.1 hypothetical protein FQ320_14145 [Oceaniovalibus sp. ACAM 378]